MLFEPIRLGDLQLAATTRAVAIGDLSVAAGVSSTHLAQRFKELIGVTPKRLARNYRFAATVFAINPAGPVDWGELATAGRCRPIDFLQDRQLTTRQDGGTPKQRRAPWAR